MENVEGNVRKEIATKSNEDGNKSWELSNLDEDDDFDVSSFPSNSLFEMPSISPLDLLNKIWDPTCFSTRNFRLLIASISKYLMNQMSIDPSVSRVRIGVDLKKPLLCLHSLWMRKRGINSCTKEEMCSFVRTHTPPKLREAILRGKMSIEEFNEWVNDYKEYVGSLPIESESARTNIESDVVKKTARGLDVLFESFVEPTTDCISQYIVLRDKQRLLSMKTPGEVGSELIRLMTFDVKDILRKNKRHWWKHAKVRVQFLNSPNDRKMRLLRQVLDEAVDDMREVPGVAKEVRNLDEDGDF